MNQDKYKDFTIEQLETFKLRRLIGVFLILIGLSTIISQVEEKQMLMGYYYDYREIVRETTNAPFYEAKHVSIKFDQLEKGYIGKAYGMMIKDVIDIVISRSAFQALTTNEKRVFMYHELAHDANKQSHCLEKRCIMFPSKSGMIITDAKDMLIYAIKYHKSHPKQTIRLIF